jgi:uncharacterized protein (DUF1684 family)
LQGAAGRASVALGDGKDPAQTGANDVVDVTIDRLTLQGIAYDESERMTDPHDHHEHHAHEEHHHHRPLDYTEAVEQFRAEKDAYFRSGPSSPVPASERDGFTGLPYYPVDVGLRFEGLTLQPYTGSEPSHFEIPTSDGKLRPAYRAGILAFDLGGEQRALAAYTFDGSEEGSLFVAFMDATTGTETYGAGRYLDLDREDDGTYTLDFNLAYHPSCVYDARFSCPLTPAENRLPLRIEAGERLAPAPG